MSQISVAVIGAGAAGLCAARHLSAAAASHDLRIKVFEQTDNIGGTWVYTDNVGTDTHGLPVHSSMYKNLKTNLPKEVMAFPDFPFPDYEESFIHHSKVLDYLKQYSDHFQLEKFINFNTKVAKVKPEVPNDWMTRWEVTSECLTTSAVTVETFDGIMVCNGHYSVPVIPDIPGLDAFNGQVIHSHNYRRPEDFAGEKVIILGGGASGTDICIELSKHADTVYLSHNNPGLPTVLPNNVHQVSGVNSCQGESNFKLNDGSEILATVILLATGYHYSFPFLSDDCGVNVTTRRVSPLFKHLININHPSMCFIGIPIQICPFPQFDLQIRYFVKIITGQLQALSAENMLADLHKDEEWRRNELKMPEKYLHKMGTIQWKYNKEMAELGDLEPICDAVENLYNAVHGRRRYCLPYYKNDSYKLVGKSGFSGSIFDQETGSYNTIIGDRKIPSKLELKYPIFIC